jgi:uroporphyrinogen III methyltransferase / synthase
VEVPAYQSGCPAAIAPPALEALQSQTVDVVTFASSKTVRHFYQLLQQTGLDWQDWIENVAVASIGPQTSNTCRDLLGRVNIEAQAYTLDGLTQAILDFYHPRDPGVPAAEAGLTIGRES